MVSPTDMQSASIATENVSYFDAKKISYLTCPDCLDLSIFYADNSTCPAWIKNSVEIMLLKFFQTFVFHVCMFFIFLSKFYGIDETIQRETRFHSCYFWNFEAPLKLAIIDLYN